MLSRNLLRLICRPISIARLARTYSGTLLLRQVRSLFAVTAPGCWSSHQRWYSSGRDISSIRSLADLVAVDAAKDALKFFWQRNGGHKSGQLHNFARLIVSIAKHWAKVPTDHLDDLRKVRREVDPGKGDMTERNRMRLRVFDDPENVERLVNLPER